GKVDVALAVKGDVVRSRQLGGGRESAASCKQGVVSGVSIDGSRGSCLAEQSLLAEQRGQQEQTFQEVSSRHLHLYIREATPGGAMPHAGWIIVGGIGPGTHGPGHPPPGPPAGLPLPSLHRNRTVALVRPPWDSTSGACGDGAIPINPLRRWMRTWRKTSSHLRWVNGRTGCCSGGKHRSLRSCERIGWQAESACPTRAQTRANQR